MYVNVMATVDLIHADDSTVITGRRLASDYSASLRVACALRPALLSGKGFFTADVVDRPTLLNEAKQAALARFPDLEVDVQIGNPGEVIAGLAEHRHSDLIVLNPKRRTGSEHVWGTTTTDVLRLAKGIDVYACHRDDPDVAISSAIIAIDGSRITEEVLADSHAVLKPTQVEPSATHVICVVPPDKRKRTQRLLDLCDAYLQKSNWSSMEVLIQDEDVTQTLDAAIRNYDADLLIIGSGENHGLGWAIGSTTNDVLHDVSCDVLVVRPSVEQ